MPVGAAAIIAVGAVGAAGVSAHASGKASKAQAQAQQEALAFEREQEAARKAEYDKAQEAYKQQWDAWQSHRLGLLRRYGVNVPDPMGQTELGGGLPSKTPTLTIGSLAASRRPGTPAPSIPTPDGQQAPEDIYGWEDWSRYAPIR